MNQQINEYMYKHTQVCMYMRVFLLITNESHKKIAYRNDKGQCDRLDCFLNVLLSLIIMPK